ncbi:helix-turn-helix domain-containing protein [Phycicoccus sp. Soil803]|uniref:helix-turn-helix domain-containing protein n=1 Tax=Phycicoccus sp. Soil803 TaxID=1736415 RepID=UPI0009E68C3F|nr:helix-turn-helix domain-containing protein [Phycicoccus sp. Soil803]
MGAIAARWGFWDAAHFSRAFKAEYGCSPRAYRERCLVARPQPAESGRHTLVNTSLASLA